MIKKGAKASNFISEQLAKTMKIGEIKTKIPEKQIKQVGAAGQGALKAIDSGLELKKDGNLEGMLLGAVKGIQKEKQIKVQGKEGIWTGKIADDFISYTNLRMSPYEVLLIRDMSIHHSINTHAIMSLTAVVDESVKDSYVHETAGISPVALFYIGGQEPVVIFYGTVTDIKTTFEGGTHLLHIQAQDMSYTMDLQRKSRSFQNTAMTSHQLIKKVMGDYADSSVMIQIPEEPIGKLVIQYMETDWEFLCRIASRYNHGVMAKMDQNQICLTVGVSEHEGQFKGKINNYRIYKELGEYQSKKAYGVNGVTENDFVSYEIVRPEILRLGEYITWNGQKFYIRQGDYSITEQVVKGRYVLRQINGFKREQTYNERIIGVSIKGVISGVKRDKVQVNMEIDGKQGGYWFPYSTVAASPDGGGWYCMPEMGEEVRVYFPLKDEAEAYAASAISGVDPESQVGDGRMSDPKNKSLKTAQGQEVKFTPSGVLIESNGGESKINLNIDGSVTVSGQKSICLTCVENLTMRAGEELKITAQDSIDLMCEAEGTLVMEGDIVVAAKNINNNC